MNKIIIFIYITIATHAAGYATTVSFKYCSSSQKTQVINVIKKTLPFVETGLTKKEFPWFESFPNKEINFLVQEANEAISVKCKTYCRRRLITSSTVRNVEICPAFFDYRVTLPVAKGYAGQKYTVCKQSEYLWKTFFVTALGYDKENSDWSKPAVDASRHIESLCQKSN